MAWAAYNLIILGAALSVAGERRQLRRTVRVEDELTAAVRKPGTRKVVQTTTFDISTGGLALVPTPELNDYAIGDPIEVALESPGRRLWLPGIVRRCDQEFLTLEFDKMSVAQESSLTQSLFGRADAWMDWRDREVRDRPMKAMAMIFRISMIGSANFWRWAGRQTLSKIGIGRDAPSPGASVLLAAVLLLFNFAAPHKWFAVVAVLLWGAVAFGNVPGLQVYVVKQAERFTPQAVDVASGLNIA
eukprot:gene8429-10731_t